MHNYVVYILTNSTKTTLYIGVTNNLKRRMFEHKNNIHKGFTQKYKTRFLVYYESFNDINKAIYREKQLKKWHREWKENLIREQNPLWEDLSKDWF